MKINNVKNVFMVHVETDVTRTDFGNRLVVGTPTLGEYIKEKLGDFSSGSKETMRGIIEQDEEHVLDMFRGRERIVVYSGNESKRATIRLISKTVES